MVEHGSKCVYLLVLGSSNMSGVCIAPRASNVAELTTQLVLVLKSIRSPRKANTSQIARLLCRFLLLMLLPIEVFPICLQRIPLLSTCQGLSSKPTILKASTKEDGRLDEEKKLFLVSVLNLRRRLGQEGGL